MPRFCINQACAHRENHDDAEVCACCHTSLEIGDRYYLSTPIRVNPSANTEVWEIVDWADFKMGGANQANLDNFLHEPKIIKILTLAHQHNVDLLNNEYEVLAQLNRWNSSLPIPKVSRQFDQSRITVGNFQGLVMSKLDGVSLETRFNQDMRIDNRTAISWFKQVLNILEQIHQAGIRHLDIHPANLILSQTGKIQLIDFGFARAEQSRLLGHGTPGYAAPELSNGQFSRVSDYFSLGKTFQTLLSGRIPNQRTQFLPKLLSSWFFPDSSIAMTQLLSDLTAHYPRERPQTIAEIRERLDWIETPWKQRRKLCQTIAAIALVSTGGVLALRTTGVLQATELKLQDTLLSWRPAESVDPRLLVVTARRKKTSNEGATLSDQELLQLLTTLKKSNPATIGLDIYRDFTVSQKTPSLTPLLQQDNLFGVCNVPAPELGDEMGIAAPPEISPTHIGFADALADRDGIIRRHLLTISEKNVINSGCPSTVDFAFLLSLHYFAAMHDLQLEETDLQANLKIAGVELKALYPGTQQRFWLDRYAGAYQQVDLGGQQILLNYRAGPSLDKIAKEVSVQQIINHEVPPEEIKDRIVLIGVVDNRAVKEDWWPDPFRSSSNSQVPGVWIQAHKTSQILSAVLDQRSLLWVFPGWGELLWVLAGGGIGALLGLRINRLPTLFGLGMSGAIVIQGGVAYVILLVGGCIPWLPGSMTGVMAIILSRGWQWFYKKQTEKKST